MTEFIQSSLHDPQIYFGIYQVETNLSVQTMKISIWAT
jgi:hypothetical protein